VILEAPKDLEVRTMNDLPQILAILCPGKGNMKMLSQTMGPATIAEYEKKYLFHTWSVQKGYQPFIIAGGEGCYFWDDQGKKYLDFASQLVNVNAGHQHPKIVQAIKDQADKICYVLPKVANDQRAMLAKMLVELAPGDLM
jgi:taurine--2-oxoglutarate transaminase